MSNLDLSYLIKQLAKAETKLVNTSIPARVLEYNPTTQLAKLELCVNRPSEDEVFTSSVLEQVPIIFPSGRGWVMAAPLEKGDGVLLHFCMYDIGNYLTSLSKDVVVQPPTLNHHDFSSVYAIPGSFTYKTPTVDPNWPERLHITKDEEYLTMDAESGTELSSATVVSLTTEGGTTLTVNTDGTVNITAATSVTIDTPATTITGTLKVDGIITAPDIVLPAASMNTHFHSDPQGGNVGPPTN